LSRRVTHTALRRTVGSPRHQKVREDADANRQREWTAKNDTREKQERIRRKPAGQCLDHEQLPRAALSMCLIALFTRPARRLGKPRDYFSKALENGHWKSNEKSNEKSKKQVANTRRYACQNHVHVRLQKLL